MFIVSNLRQNFGRQRKAVSNLAIIRFHKGFVAATEMRGPSFTCIVCLTFVSVENTDWKLTLCDVTHPFPRWRLICSLFPFFLNEGSKRGSSLIRKLIASVLMTGSEQKARYAVFWRSAEFHE